ncbi:MAG: DapH/DapD/GlmU-related protein [Candidatus Saccharimonadaceae bacterium]
MATKASETKIVLSKEGDKNEVPQSTAVTDRQAHFGWGYEIGEDCVIGNGARIEGKLGNRVEVGSKSSVGSRCEIGDGTTIGDNTSFGERCIVGQGVTIGDRCEIESGVRIQSGVVIPDNWHLPRDAIINPGPNGTPVVIMPQSQFRCNVQGSLRAVGNGFY